MNTVTVWRVCLGCGDFAERILSVSEKGYYELPVTNHRHASGPDGVCNWYLSEAAAKVASENRRS